MLTVVEPVPEGAVVLVWVLSSSRSSSLRELSVESELDDAGGRHWMRLMTNCWTKTMMPHRSRPRAIHDGGGARRMQAHGSGCS